MARIDLFDKKGNKLYQYNEVDDASIDYDDHNLSFVCGGKEYIWRGIPMFKICKGKEKKR